MRKYRIRPTMQAADLRNEFEATDRGHVRTSHWVNGEAARALYRWLRDEALWGLKVCDGSRIVGIAPEKYAQCMGSDVRECSQIAYEAAQTGFAFMREELWCLGRDLLGSDGGAAMLNEFSAFVRSAEFTDFIGAVTGYACIDVVRLTVERYRRGHFFAFTSGPPPDAQLGFSFELTPTWSIGWGGLLEFCDFFGGIERAYAPRFNALTVYALSRARGVSFVAPFAQADRYAVVGQLSVQ